MKATKIISACAVLVALASCSNDHVISQPGAEDTPHLFVSRLQLVE